MYVSEICAEGIFVTFTWWLKKEKSRSKIALFSNERHFEIWFSKNKTITFFWSKSSKLHKKDRILHVTTTFSLKQGETRTNIVPIPPPQRAAHTVSYFQVSIPPHRFAVCSPPASVNFNSPLYSSAKNTKRYHHIHSISRPCPYNRPPKLFSVWNMWYY